ncbi:MAG: taurine---2-oxoglutarate transaminase, partial [Mycobacterium sp.]|nr:taurine---2-oxoglutarate transaminase [Mycobacterium sp.]
MGVGARARIAVGAPAVELGGVAEPVAFHVVVADLDHLFRSQRHEREILAGVPARGFIVFIADEVMAGFGRSGKWFAIDHFDVTPDLLTFAKGVNSGYVPLGGVAINPAIAETFAHRAYPGGLTYSGHPLATAAAVATINAMEDEGIVANAARMGDEVIGPLLRDIAARHRCVGEVRGTGVFWALELVADEHTREPLAPYGGTSEAMTAVVRAC